MDGPGGGEHVPLLAEQLGHGFAPPDDGHEVGVSLPARHDVLVEVGGDPCTGDLAWFIPRLNPWGRLTERTTLMAVAVSSPISWRSAGVASVQSEMCR